MSSVGDWLSARRPMPPESLQPWLVPGRDEVGVRESLTAAGCAEMEWAAAHPGPVRESALHLLAADALITYACEAALETLDPAAALRATLRTVGPPGTPAGET